jgi:hypothetical protein
MDTPTIKIPNMGARQPDVLSPPRRTVLVLVIDAQSILAQGFRRTTPRFQKYSRPIRSKGDRPQVGHGQTTTITEHPPVRYLKSKTPDRMLRCMVLFWLFFVLVLVLVLDRARNCIIPSRSTRCSGRNLVIEVTNRIMEIRSVIRKSGNGGLWAVRQGALMPCTRSVRLRLRAPSATAD